MTTIANLDNSPLVLSRSQRVSFSASSLETLLLKEQFLGFFFVFFFVFFLFCLLLMFFCERGCMRQVCPMVAMLMQYMPIKLVRGRERKRKLLLLDSLHALQLLAQTTFAQHNVNSQ